MAVTEVITFEYGEPETGIWCETCLLPSAVAFPVILTFGGGTPQLKAVQHCLDCDQTRWI